MNEQQLQTIKQAIEHIQNDDAQPILVSPMAQVAYEYAPALLAEVERLKRVNKAIMLGVDKQKAFESMFKQQLVKSQKLGEALVFYADETKYERVTLTCGDKEIYIERDCGEIARKALDGEQ